MELHNRIVVGVRIELGARGVQSLRHSDCMEIVENLIVRLKELDQELAAGNIEPS